MENLYVVLVQIPGEGNPRPLAEIRADVELLKGSYAARFVGKAPMGMGLLYATPQPLPQEAIKTRGVIEWI